MHIANRKLSFDIFTVRNLQNNLQEITFVHRHQSPLSGPHGPYDSLESDFLRMFSFFCFLFVFVLKIILKIKCTAVKIGFKQTWLSMQ